MNTVFELENLSVEVRGRDQEVVSNISLEIEPGEVHALIGESGSGKTTIALSALHYFRAGLMRAEGQIRLGGEDLNTKSAEALRRLRGNRVSYVAQSAAAAFNPARRINDQIAEVAREHGGLSEADALARARTFFAEMDLPDPENIGHRYPHEVSGGQLQRVMAAMAMVPTPDLIVFDEPTTALDVTTQLSVLVAFKKLIRSHRTAAIFVSHDLAVVAQIADSVTVLQNGRMVEQQTMRGLLDEPREAYSKQLLKAGLPDLEVPDKAMDQAHEPAPVLSLEGVTAGYGAIGSDGLPAYPVLREITLHIPRGEVVGVIGESGSGKSTLAKVISGLLPQAVGNVSVEKKRLNASLTRRSLDSAREIQLVSQYADTALNPQHSIRKILQRPLIRFGLAQHGDIEDRLLEMMERVALSPDLLSRRPEALSGGQKQRVNLARALLAQPKVILCDEVTSALDAIVRDNIIGLVRDLRDQFGLSILFITHDISTVSKLADRVVVMHNGRLVEQGPCAHVLGSPQKPYTQKLLTSVPRAEAGWLEKAHAKIRAQNQKAHAHGSAR